MRIAFFSNKIDFSPKDYENNGLGGSESALINILNYWPHSNDEIIVYNGIEEKAPWRTVYQFYSEVRTFDVDVLVLVRDIRPLLFPYIDAKSIVLWSQDDENEPPLQKLANMAYAKARLNKVLAVSDYAKHSLEGLLNLDVDVFRNGYRPDLVDPMPKEPIAIYTSTPFRGLEYLKSYWPEIHYKCRGRGVKPSLYICGNMSLYKQSNDSYKSLYEELEDLPDVTVFGSIPQKSLYMLLNKTKVMLYPNCYTETSCMAVLEALACGNFVVTTDRGALSEQVNELNGVCIPGSPNEKEYRKRFVESAVDILCYDSKPVVNTVYSWSEQAQKMRDMLEAL